MAGKRSRYTYTYTPEEMGAWKAWYRESLLHGRRWFRAALPGDGGLVVREARYISVQEAMLGAGIYRVTAELEERGAFDLTAPQAEVDPFWDDVLLLLKFDDQADGSATITDSSPYADHKTASTGLEVDTGRAKYGGGSMLATRRGPVALTYNATRFVRPIGTAMTLEGWCRRAFSVNATATPPIFLLWDNLDAEVARLAQYALGNQVETRFGTSDSATQHSYSPADDGWWYWMVRIAADDSAQLWLNTTLARSVSSTSVWTGGGTLRIGGFTSTSSEAIDFNFDDIRVTAADRYPSGVTSLPGPFPVGPF